MLPLGTAFSGDGAGTSSDPYMVEDCSMLDEVRDEKDAYYALSSDIDCSGTSFQSVDDFSGVLDGQGHVIHNLEIDEPGSSHVGLIGHAIGGAEVKDIGVENADVTGQQFAGILVGELSDATLSRAYVADSMITGGDGSDEVGPLVGLLRGSTPLVEDAYSIGSSASGDSDVGGLVGQINDGEIRRTYSVSSATLGTTEGTEGVLLGKLFGGSVYNSYWQDDIEPMKSDGGTEKTEEQLKQISTFGGWDFDTVWERCPSGNSGYPFLQGVGDHSCAEPEISLPTPSGVNTHPSGVEPSIYVEHDEGREVNVTFYDSSNQVIDEKENMAPGQVISASWDGLDHESSYQWHANVTDGITEVRSSYHDFTTITVDFSWDDNTRIEDGYRVFANDTSTFNEVRRTSPDVESVEIAPEGLEFGTWYCFRSVAYNSAGQSGYTEDCLQP
jgi:hypothetical protein